MTTYIPLSFSELSGWPNADHAAALSVYRVGQEKIGPAFPKAPVGVDPRLFFETKFQPVLIDDGSAAHFTGYYEPELAASPTKSGAFRHPIYGLPPDHDHSASGFSRREIDLAGALMGKAPVLTWANDPVDLFFLHVQGSGRLVMPDGARQRIGFAGKNGHPYVSIGKLLIEQGVFSTETISAEGIKDWLRTYPENAPNLMAQNPSYVFFRNLPNLTELDGPIGTLGVPISAGISVAVDPEHTPLGAPVWIDVKEHTEHSGLKVAQDTGGAINGSQRADIFFGTGTEAGKAAGQLNTGGRLVVLLPNAMVADLVQGNE